MRHEKTRKLNRKIRCSVFHAPCSTKPGFTLIEVLIASAIFATVMVMTTAVISQSSTYQSRLRAARLVSDETRKVADLITRDVQAARGGVKINMFGEDISSGMALIYCNTAIPGHPCNTINSSTPRDPSITTEQSANVLVLFSPDSFQIYISSSDYVTTGKIAYLSKTGAGVDPATELSGTKIKDILFTHWSGTLPGLVDDPNKQITNNSYVTFVKFWGYAPNTTAAIKQQPYVTFLTSSLTPNYSSLLATQRNQAQIKSTIVLRNYD